MRLGLILSRHVLREVALAFIAVALVLLALLVTNQLAFVLGRAADGQIPAELVLQLVGLSVSENSTIILPVALMLGIVVALGRLYHDSELAAAQACGSGPGMLFVPVGALAAVTAIFCGWIAFYQGPAAAQRSFEIRNEAMRTAATRGLTPGRFRSLGSGAVLYFESIDEQGVLHNVFFQRRVRRELRAPAAPATAAPAAQAAAKETPTAVAASGEAPPATPGNPPAPAPPTATAPGTVETGRIEIVIASAARYFISDDASIYTVVLYDGQSYDGVPGQGAWRTVRFREQVVPVRTPEGGSGRVRTDLQTTPALLASRAPEFRAELHWRIAMPVMVLLVAGLAVPIGRLRPRQGRYARVGWVIVLYAIYANLLVAGRTWIERGVVPEWLGLWWVHALVLAIGLGIVFVPRLVARLRYRVAPA